MDSTEDVSKNITEPLINFNTKLFDCFICSQRLSIPVFQCDNGHIVCSTCCPKRGIKCPKCALHFSSKRCKVIENILKSMEMSCPNAKHGCREKISYTRKRKQEEEEEEEYINESCYCPISGCDFVASSDVLSYHVSDKHKYSQIKFSYDHSFIVSLKSNDETIFLQEENDGKLFTLNNSTMLLGNTVHICCIGPNSSKSEHSYDIFARSQICKQKFEALVTNVQRFTAATISSGFLVIPFGSSESVKLEICISSPMMQIYIRNPIGWMIPLKVKSSDTIVNVKKKILDMEHIPVHMQHLIYDKKQLEDNLTLASYNIQEKATLRLRFTGEYMTTTSLPIATFKSRTLKTFTQL